ncbi:MAG: threonine synthase [Fimbriimonas sp.]|nr:threonine synthase [Fimbriimonas sp.]
MRKWGGLIARYGARLAISQSVEPVTLYEGDTPLIPAPRLGDAVVPGGQLFLKYEGLNPTGSFKDRGMTTAITQAVADGARSVVCASTGNTAASAAAYAARAGLKCIVLIPDGKIALGKLAGAVAYGARVIAVKGSFDDGLRMVREASERAPVALVNSVNPARLQGQKTAAWEVTEQLGQAPDWLCLPIGNAGNITAYWLGFCEDEKGLPRLLGAQAAGAAPLIQGKQIKNPETRATAIRIGNPARWQEAVSALERSNGHVLSVTDDEIFAAYHMTARLEGIFCEPSSAAGVAGLIKSVASGKVNPEGKRFVCVLTGHGLKDPDSAVDGAERPISIAPTTAAFLEVLGV